MRRWTVRAAVAVAVLAAAPAVAGAADFCARVLVGSERVDPLRGESVYSVRKVEDLRFLVTFLQPIRGEHVVELRLLTPGGHHYETLTAPVTTKAGERGTERRVARYPRPLPVQVLESVTTPDGRVQGTELRWPVAGTSVVSGSLYGTWEVEVLLDGQPMACEVRNLFTLED